MSSDREAPPLSARTLSCAALVVFVVVTFASHWQALSMPFYADDALFIAQKWSELNGGLLTYMGVATDRPIGMAVIWLNYFFGGLNPAAFRAVTMVLHAVTGLALFNLLWFFGRRYLKLATPWIPLAVAFLFVIHPVHVEAIQIVCQRCVILAALFSILTVYFYMRFVDGGVRRHYTISVICFLFALASKANAIAVPPILALYVLGFHAERVRRLPQELAPFLLALILPPLYYLVLGFNQQNAMPWHEYLRMELRVIFIYFRLFFLPIHLHYLYYIDAKLGWLSPWTIAAIFGHLAVLGTATWLWIRRNQRILAFSVFSVYLALLPESSFFPIHYPMWEYRTYLPLAFFSIGIMAAVAKLKQIEKPVMLVPLGVLAVAAGIVDYNRYSEMMTLKGFLLSVLKYDAKNPKFDSEVLSNALYVEDLKDGPRMLEMISKGRPEWPELPLFRAAFKYLSQEKGKRDRALLDYIGSKLMLGFDMEMSPFGRQAFNELLTRHLGDHLSPVEFYKKLEEIMYPQAVYLERKPIIPVTAGFFTNYSIVLNYLTDYYGKSRAAKRVSVSDEIQQLRVLAALEVFFGRATSGLGDRFEALLKKHGAAPGLRETYEWYKTAQRKPVSE